MPFNENHRRYLLATFQHIDKLIARAVAAIGPANGSPLFPSCAPDVTPAQRQIIADSLSNFWNVARRFLDAVPVRPDAPSKGALWSFHVALDFVWVSLAELEPKHLANYGPLDEDAASETERALAELQAILRQLTEYLDREMGGGVQSHA